ncbi:MAG: adenylyltransferase/cytidyltransferase family protein [Patescibacteria group bacterium]
MVPLRRILGTTVDLKDRFIADYEVLTRTIESFRQVGHPIVMTQGVYDLLHIGHARYLAEALKAGGEGAILVVAVDSDEYTRLRKGKANERRPAVPFEERLELLANIRSVNILTIRDVDRHVDDPMYIIRLIKPDVLVMSKSTKDISEEDHRKLKELCGELVVLEPTATISTTARLRDLMIDGAGGLVDHIDESLNSARAAINGISTAIEDYFHREGRTVKLGKKEGDKQ